MLQDQAKNFHLLTKRLRSWTQPISTVNCSANAIDRDRYLQLITYQLTQCILVQEDKLNGCFEEFHELVAVSFCSTAHTSTGWV